MIKTMMRKMYYTFFKKNIYIYIGEILLDRSLVSEETINKCKDDLFVNKNKDIISISVKSAIMEQYYKKNEAEQQKENIQKLWGSEAGVRYNENKRTVYEAEDFAFMKSDRGSFIDTIKKNAQKFGVKKIVEIGTGNGVLLYFLSTAPELKNVKEFIGIDIAQKQIDINKERYGASGLIFENEGADEYIKKTEKDEKTLYMFAGTLEYFTPNEIEDLFKNIKKKESSVTLLEPVNIDLETTFESESRGGIAYSHNYAYILEKSGFTIIQKLVESNDKNNKNYNNVVIYAIPSLKKETNLNITNKSG